jgi:hypothetical protein
MRVLLLLPVLLLACDKGGKTESPPKDGERPSLSASDCEAKGGTVVGDIGDGAIHRPDYVCPESGKPPIGTIAADPGGPVAIEGSVCCPA